MPSPDELVHQIFKLQRQREPNDDPGDIEISVQDDSALVSVYQPRWDGDQLNPLVSHGASIEDALTAHLQAVKATVRQ